MRVDEPELADKISPRSAALDAEAEEIRDACGRIVARNFQMWRAWALFRGSCRPPLSGFPIRTGVLGWEEYLPPLEPRYFVSFLKHTAGCLPYDVPRSYFRSSRTGSR